MWILAKATFPNYPDTRQQLKLRTRGRFDHMRIEGVRRYSSAVTFLGAGQEVAHTAPELVEFQNLEDPTLGLSPLSVTSNAYDNGYMFVPGRWRKSFPEETQMSMVIDPKNPKRFCEQGSLFYTGNRNGIRYDLWFTVHAQIRVVAPHEQADQIVSAIEGWLSRDEYLIDSSIVQDRVPQSVIQALLRHLTPNNVSNRLPEYLENCNIKNGGYPSIYFRVMQEGMNGFTHKGLIVYGPEDYLEYEGRGRCTFKIRGSDAPSFGINFLTKVAVHFRSHELGFCDATKPPK
jgi:hypothetical protein